MTEREYQDWLKPSMFSYAQAHVEAGNWSANEALQRAQKEFDELLPNGLQTENHYLYSIVDATSGDQVGILWFAVREHGAKREAFVYDIEVFERFRRHGYAAGAFSALEERASELGLTAISLHVFGSNAPARALYEKLGFVTTNVLMSKSLDG